MNRYDSNSPVCASHNNTVVVLNVRSEALSGGTEHYLWNQDNYQKWKHPKYSLSFLEYNGTLNSAPIKTIMLNVMYH